MYSHSILTAPRHTPLGFCVIWSLTLPSGACSLESINPAPSHCRSPSSRRELRIPCFYPRSSRSSKISSRRLLGRYRCWPHTRSLNTIFPTLFARKRTNSNGILTMRCRVSPSPLNRTPSFGPHTSGSAAWSIHFPRSKTGRGTKSCSQMRILWSSSIARNRAVWWFSPPFTRRGNSPNWPIDG